MRLKLRFLGGTLVLFALTVAAIYLLIELREFLEEEFFSDGFPQFLHIIYTMFMLVVGMIIIRFTIAKSASELVELNKQKKTRRKRESDIEDP